MTLFLLLLLALPPGAVRSLTHQQVCGIKWGLDVRHVTRKMRQEVAKRDGVSWSHRHRYVVDHLVPRQLAGADDLANLWMQPKRQAKKKDVVEMRLHKAVCAGQLSLTDAQERMRQWTP